MNILLWAPYLWQPMKAGALWWLRILADLTGYDLNPFKYLRTNVWSTTRNPKLTRLVHTEMLFLQVVPACRLHVVCKVCDIMAHA